jgi:hypothetical protein
MATIEQVRAVKVWLNGHNMGRCLSRFKLTAGPFNVVADFGWADLQSVEFDHCAACANRDKVQMVVQFGECPPSVFTGRLESANSNKSMDRVDECSAVFCGEPVHV